MTEAELSELRPGDVVRHKLHPDHPYIVHANYGGRVTAVRTADLTNPEEWEVYRCTPEHKQLENLLARTANYVMAVKMAADSTGAESLLRHAPVLLAEIYDALDRASKMLDHDHETG